jgi:hypothetical protein
VPSGALGRKAASVTGKMIMHAVHSIIYKEYMDTPVHFDLSKPYFLGFSGAFLVFDN